MKRQRRWRLTGVLTSTEHAVVHVRDTTLPLEDPDAFQFDVLRPKTFEQTAAFAEEHGDDIELDLVEHAGDKCELRGSGTVDQHVLRAGSVLGLSHCRRDVVYVCDQRPTRQFAPVAAGQDGDRYAGVMVAAP